MYCLLLLLSIFSTTACYNLLLSLTTSFTLLTISSTVTWPYLLLLPRSLFLSPHVSQLSSIFPLQLVLLLLLAPLQSSLMADALFFHIFLRSPRSSSRLWSRNCRVTSSRPLFSPPVSRRSTQAQRLSTQGKLSHAHLLRQTPPQTKDRGPGVHHSNTPDFVNESYSQNPPRSHKVNMGPWLEQRARQYYVSRKRGAVS